MTVKAELIIPPGQIIEFSTAFKNEPIEVTAETDVFYNTNYSSLKVGQGFKLQKGDTVSFPATIPPLMLYFFTIWGGKLSIQYD